MDVSSNIPACADVVIIGGGIIGVCTAYFLAARGLRPVLFEKGRIAGEQSGRNWGWCRTIARDPLEIPLSLDSMGLWDGMNERVGAETGFRRSGILYFCETEQDVEHHRRWLEEVREYRLDCRLIRREELASLCPGGTRRWAGALYAPNDGRAEPAVATEHIASAAVRWGASVITNCAVRGLETMAGAVSAVVTEKGRVNTNRVVLAGGAWSRLFLGSLGIIFPQLTVRSSVMQTRPLIGGPECAAAATDFAFRRNINGGYVIAHRGANVVSICPDSFRLLADFLPSFWKQRKELRLRVDQHSLSAWKRPRHWSLDEISPFEKMRVLEAEPDQKILNDGLANLAAAYPIFKDVGISASWAGFIEATPDELPVMSPINMVPGLFLASGFSGHGFGIGPGAGKMIAAMVAGEKPDIDPGPFRYERLAKHCWTDAVRAAA